MKTKLMTSISVIALMGLISISSVYSQEIVAQSHEEHHPDSKTMPDKSSDMKMNDMNMDSKDMNGMKLEGKDGVMNKAEMTKMNIMMKDCMKIHNDTKMCSQAAMENCQKQMKKNDCQKIMRKE